MVYRRSLASFLAGAVALTSVPFDLGLTHPPMAKALFEPFSANALMPKLLGSPGIDSKRPRSPVHSSFYQLFRRFAVPATAAGLAAQTPRPSKFDRSQWVPELEQFDIQAYREANFKNTPAEQFLGFMTQFAAGRKDFAKRVADHNMDANLHANFLQVKRNAMAILRTMPSVQAELNEILLARGFVPASNDEDLWDLYLFCAMPAYFGKRGLLFMNMGTSPIQGPQWTAEMYEMGVLIDMWPIDSVRPVEEEVLGSRVASREIHISRRLQMNGQPLSDWAPMAQTYYQSYMVLDPVIEDNVTRWMAEDVKWSPASEQLYKNLVWTPDVLVENRTPSPFEFLNIKLNAKEAALNVPADKIRAWFLRQVRFHELRHLFDFRRGHFVKGGPALYKTWEEMDAQFGRSDVGREIEGRLAEARHALREDKQRELLRFVTDGQTKESRVDKLINFNLLRLMIAHIAQDPGAYAAIRLFPGASVSLNGQILAQLDLLSPEDLDRVWDGVLAMHEANPEDIQMPQTVDINALFDGPRLAKSPVNRIGPPVAVSVGVVLAGVASWRLYRPWGARRQVRRDAEVESLREDFAPYFKNKPMPDELPTQLAHEMAKLAQFEARLRENKIDMKRKEIQSLILRARKAGERALQAADPVPATPGRGTWILGAAGLALLVVGALWWTGVLKPFQALLILPFLQFSLSRPISRRQMITGAILGGGAMAAGTAIYRLLRSEPPMDPKEQLREAVEKGFLLDAARGITPADGLGITSQDVQTAWNALKTFLADPMSRVLLVDKANFNAQLNVQGKTLEVDRLLWPYIFTTAQPTVFHEMIHFLHHPLFSAFLDQMDAYLGVLSKRASSPARNQEMDRARMALLRTEWVAERQGKWLAMADMVFEARKREMSLSLYLGMRINERADDLGISFDQLMERLKTGPENLEPIDRWLYNAASYVREYGDGVHLEPSFEHGVIGAYIKSNSKNIEHVTVLARKYFKPDFDYARVVANESYRTEFLEWARIFILYASVGSDGLPLIQSPAALIPLVPAVAAAA